MIFEYDGVLPEVEPGVFIAPNAVLLGRVKIGTRSSVWFGSVLRGDTGEIVVGSGTSVQDNVVVHAPRGGRTLIGKNVTLGHGCILEGCIIEDGAVIGMNSVVLHGARVGAGALVAAGSVVVEKMEVPPGYLAAGNPAQIKKPLSDNARSWINTSAPAYQDLASKYLSGKLKPLADKQS
ncbi:MAG TPA: gamma carbonic anhydrase family protein [Acidobacteriota bacterium]|jgi:carbonic anhydrase/acetyltransferase-like protein (isoleucine patch superfamily)